MVIAQSRSRRKPSGARFTATNPKRKHQIGRAPALTRTGSEDRVKTLRTKGGNTKRRLLEVQHANVFDPATGKSQVVELVSVTENPANRHFVRRNILTKGTVVDTKAGKARVTNRPGQEGVVNAVLVK